MWFFEVLIGDKFFFILIQLVIVLLSLFALFKDKTRSKLMVIGRGDGNRRLFVTSAGAIITILVSVIFQISNYPVDGKILFYLSDLILVGYLCFYSSWFTNKLVYLKNSFKEREF